MNEIVVDQLHANTINIQDTQAVRILELERQVDGMGLVIHGLCKWVEVVTIFAFFPRLLRLSYRRPHVPRSREHLSFFSFLFFEHSKDLSYLILSFSSPQQDEGKTRVIGRGPIYLAKELDWPRVNLNLSASEISGYTTRSLLSDGQIDTIRPLKARSIVPLFPFPRSLSIFASNDSKRVLEGPATSGAS